MLAIGLYKESSHIALRVGLAMASPCVQILAKGCGPSLGKVSLNNPRSIHFDWHPNSHWLWPPSWQVNVIESIRGKRPVEALIEHQEKR